MSDIKRKFEVDSNQLAAELQEGAALLKRMSGVKREVEVGLYKLTTETVDRIEGTPADWVDANLREIVAGAERVLRDESGSPNAVLARDILRHARALAAYRSDRAIEPALWEMMGLVLTATMLDTNLWLGRTVRAKVKEQKNLKRGRLKASDEAIVAASSVARSQKDAARRAGLSTRQHRRRKKALIGK